jgi:hypothetical protein
MSKSNICEKRLITRDNNGQKVMTEAQLAIGQLIKRKIVLIY